MRLTTRVNNRLVMFGLPGLDTNGGGWMTGGKQKSTFSMPYWPGFRVFPSLHTTHPCSAKMVIIYLIHLDTQLTNIPGRLLSRCMVYSFNIRINLWGTPTVQKCLCMGVEQGILFHYNMYLQKLYLRDCLVFTMSTSESMSVSLPLSSKFLWMIVGYTLSVSWLHKEIIPGGRLCSLPERPQLSSHCQACP